MKKKFIDKKNFYKKVKNVKEVNKDDVSNVPNCYFGHVYKTPKYSNEYLEKYKKQRLTRGFDDTELFNLDFTFSSYMIPRLKEFSKQTNCYPSDFNSINEWKDCISKMIEYFEFVIDTTKYEEELIVELFGEKYSIEYSDTNWFYNFRNVEVSDREYWEKKRDELYKEKQKGMEYFCKYFTDLWW